MTFQPPSANPPPAESGWQPPPGGWQPPADTPPPPWRPSDPVEAPIAGQPLPPTRKSRRGLVIGVGAGLLLLLIVVSAALVASRASGGTPLAKLRRGECFNLSKGLGGDQAKRVKCSKPHTDQVAGVIRFPAGGSYPGRNGILDLGKSGCPLQVTEFYGNKPPANAATFVFGPDEAAWDKGDRAVVCSLREPSSARRTGSFLDG